MAGRSLLSLSAVFTTVLVKSTLNSHIELLTAATNIVSQPHSLAANHRLSSDLFWPSDFPHDSSSSFVPFVNNISLSIYFQTLTLTAPEPRYNVLLVLLIMLTATECISHHITCLMDLTRRSKGYIYTLENWVKLWSEGRVVSVLPLRLGQVGIILSCSNSWNCFS